MIFDLKKAKYRVEGHGLPVYLIGSQFMTLKAWDAVFQDLTRYCKVIALQYPNQGDSPTDIEMNNLSKYAEYSKDFLRAIDVNSEEIIVFGLSFGANIIKSLTFDYNQVFKAAILAGVSSFKVSKYICEDFRVWISLIDLDRLDILSRIISLKIFSPEYIVNQNDAVKFTERRFVEGYKNRKEALKCLLEASINYLSTVDVTSDNSFPFDVHMIGAKGDLAMPFDYVKKYSDRIKAQLYSIEGGHILISERHFDFMNVLHEIINRYDN